MRNGGSTGQAATATLRLRFLNYRVDVETNSFRAANRLQSYFGDYLSPTASPPDLTLHANRALPSYDESRMKIWERPSQPDRAPKESFYDHRNVRYVLKNRTGMLITLPHDPAAGTAAITGDVDRHVNQVVNLVGTLFGLSLVESGYFMLHASAVARTGLDEALIFLGNSGSGKSSLALQLIERGGFDFVSNDRVLLKPKGAAVHVVGLPKKPRVNPGTLLASKQLSRLVDAGKRTGYEKLTPAELWRLEEKHDVDVASHLGARSRLDATLSRVYSLEWRTSGEGLRVEDLDAEGAIKAMAVTAKDFGPFDIHRESRDAAAASAKVARTTPFVRVSGHTDPRSFAKCLIKQAV